MTKALGLSVFTLILLSPFIEWVHLAFALMTVAIACIFWIYLEAKKRLRDMEINEAALQVELSEFVRNLNDEARDV